MNTPEVVPQKHRLYLSWPSELDQRGVANAERFVYRPLVS